MISFFNSMIIKEFITNYTRHNNPNDRVFANITSSVDTFMRKKVESKDHRNLFVLDKLPKDSFSLIQQHEVEKYVSELTHEFSVFCFKHKSTYQTMLPFKELNENYYFTWEMFIELEFYSGSVGYFICVPISYLIKEREKKPILPPNVVEGTSGILIDPSSDQDGSIVVPVTPADTAIKRVNRISGQSSISNTIDIWEV